jgi:hypothetical protein
MCLRTFGPVVAPPRHLTPDATVVTGDNLLTINVLAFPWFTKYS